MTKRVKRLSLGIGVALVLSLFLLAVPFTRDAVVGLARREPFYNGWPTRSWDRAIRQARAAEEAPPPPTWLDRLLGRSPCPWHDGPFWIRQGDADAVPLFVQLLQSDDAHVRMTAAWTLGWLGCREDLIVPALEAALRDEAPEVRTAAAAALQDLTGVRPDDRTPE
jgi:hypothetical protein